jgi:hypothetical protein
VVNWVDLSRASSPSSANVLSMNPGSVQVAEAPSTADLMKSLLVFMV